MRPVRFLLAGTSIGPFLLAHGLLAAEWQREVGVSVGAYISDNICLSNDGKKVWGAGTAAPDIFLSGRGARANVFLEATANYNTLAHSNLNCSSGQNIQRNNREAVIPSVRYFGDLEVVDDWLTLESDAYAISNSIDPFAAGDRGNNNGLFNTNITYHYGAGAVLQRRFAQDAGLRLRYYHNEQQNTASLLGDSSEDLAEFDFGSEPGRRRISLGIGGRHSEIMYEESSLRPAFNNTLSSAHVRASLQLSSSLQINGLGGEEWNEFTSAQPEIDGTYWDAGVRWAPNDRVTIAIGTGERFFGSTPRMSIRYRHRRSELSANYAHTLIFPRDLRIADNAFGTPFDPDADPDLDVDFDQLPGDPLTLRGEPTFIGNTPILNKRLNIRYRYNARRSTFTLSASNSSQTRTEDLAEATFSDIGAIFSRALNTNMSANASLGYRETEGQGDVVGIFGESSQTWTAGLGFIRQLSNSTSMNLGYQYTQRESDFVLNQYSENRVTISARHQF